MTMQPDTLGSAAASHTPQPRRAPSQETVKRAIDWRVRLQAGTASATDMRAWQRWIDDAPEHAEAWARLEAIDGQVQSLPPRLAHAALDRRMPSRRRALAIVGAGTLGLVLGSRTRTWQSWTADYHTAIGERRSVQLPDGTVIDMNTDTAFNVRQDAQVRLLTLIQGEIFVATGGHDMAAPPPFIVRGRDGDMQALGTRFQIHQQDSSTTLSVYQHAVSLRPGGATTPRIVNEGQAVRFDHARIQAVDPALAERASWRDGILVARRMRLDAFLAELGRYRPGWLHCDDRVASLELSGTFSLDDTDLTLASIADALPVRIAYQTRYWVSVQPLQK